MSKMTPQLSSGVRPCGEWREFALCHEPMNYRELRAMWNQLRIFAEGYEKLLNDLIREEDAHNYQI